MYSFPLSYGPFVCFYIIACHSILVIELTNYSLCLVTLLYFILFPMRGRTLKNLGNRVKGQCFSLLSVKTPWVHYTDFGFTHVGYLQ